MRPYAAASGRWRAIVSKASNAAPYSPSSMCASPRTPIIPRVIRVHACRAGRDVDRLAEAMLRLHGAEHLQRVVVARLAVEHRLQHALRLQRVAAIGFDAGPPERRLRERHRCAPIGGVDRQLLLGGVHCLLEIAARGRHLSGRGHERRGLNPCRLLRVDRRGNSPDGYCRNDEHEALSLAHG